MDRQDIVLAVLGAAGGGRYSPAQLQKALFLIDRNLPGLITEGPGFDFKPYDYGPFDKSVYDHADRLAAAGMAQVDRVNSRGFRFYSASEQGVRQARERLAALSEAQRDYISRVSEWVRSLDFAQLVKSIYQEYPEMRANSIFVD